MPRRGVLTAAERSSLLALPESESEFARIFTFGESDLTRIRQRRGDANRLGFAVQMALLRFPGNGLATDGRASTRLIELAARQLEIDSRVWPTYAARVETRREHLIELRSYLGLRQFGLPEFRETVAMLVEIALRSDKGILLVQHAIERLRREHIVVPAVAVLERACAEAITRADRQIYRTLTRSLSTQQLEILSALLTVKPETNITWLTWLRQSPLKPNSVQMLTHIARLTLLQAVALPPGIEQSVHQNRLLKIARDGAQMTPADLEKFANDRRFATLVAMVIEATATVTDQIVDLHDRILGKLFNAARNRHQQQFHKSGKEINAKIRLFSKVGLALLVAREAGEDAFSAIESVVPWDTFVESVADAGRLAQPDSFDYIHLIGENYATIRRYAPEMLSDPQASCCACSSRSSRRARHPSRDER